MAAVLNWPWHAISASGLRECNYTCLPLKSEFIMVLAGCTGFYSRLGLGAAKRILLAAERISSQELLQMGYLDRLVDSAKLNDQTDELAQHVASLAPLAVRGMKQALNQIANGHLNETDAETAIAQCLTSADLSEGIAAKSAKRAPRFTGR